MQVLIQRWEDIPARERDLIEARLILGNER